jgi:integrase
MRSVAVHLRTHRASGRLCKTIGYCLKKSGGVTKKTFYFDPAKPDEALKQVLELKAKWRVLRAQGKRVWDQTFDREPNSKDEKSPPHRGLITVAEAARLYLGELEARFNAGQITRCHLNSQGHRLRLGISSLDDLPLSGVGEKPLQEAVLRLAKRPKCRRPGKGVPSQMSPVYAKSIIASMRFFFSWCAESDQVDWTPPKRFRSVFNARTLLTHDEQVSQLEGDKQIQCIEIDELTKLWTAATDFQRTLICLGLNCAFGAMECSTLRTSEWHGDVIERYRGKTIKSAGKASYARWRLWPETVAHLSRNQAPKNEWNFVLLNAAGRPLVEELPKYRKDEIAHQWIRLIARTGIHRLSFGKLRKTAAQLVRTTLGYGREVADMLLSHADTGVIRHYADRDWIKLQEATDSVRRYLAPMFCLQTEFPPLDQ